MKKSVLILYAIGTILTLSGCGRGQSAMSAAAQRLEADTRYICEEIGIRPTGTEKEQEACDWLEEQLEELGFSYEAGTLVRTRFEGFPGMYSENLTAVCNPAGQGDIWCVVAHYDSIETSPGARDNAASVAVLLEIARTVSKWDADTDAQLRMIFLGSEENGYHGSRAYVEGLSAQELERHVGAFDLDISAATAGEGQLVCCTLGGETDRGYRSGDFMEPADNRITRAVKQVCEKLYGEQPPVVHGGESDHVTFHQWEIDSANVCWRRVEDGLPVLPPEYHGTDDVPETIDYETAVMTAACVLGAVELVTGWN